jgi:hypothetical protein
MQNGASRRVMLESAVDGRKRGMIRFAVELRDVSTRYKVKLNLPLIRGLLSHDAFFRP